MTFLAVVIVAATFALRGLGSGHAAACGGSPRASVLPHGNYPLAVTVRPLRIGPKGAGTYEISVTDDATRSVPRACIVIVQRTRSRSPKTSNGNVRGPAAIKETTNAEGPSYSILVRPLRAGVETRFRVVTTPARAQGRRLSCLNVEALVPGAAAFGDATFQDSLQAVCTFSGKTPPPLLPIEISLRGPSQTRTGQMSKYTVTLRNRSSHPVHDIGIGVSQVSTPPTSRGIAVATDWGLENGTRLRHEVQVKTLGSTPITFHLWWRARRGQLANKTLFAIEAYDARDPNNGRELISAELLSPLN